jgi:hypothetical protein
MKREATGAKGRMETTSGVCKSEVVEEEGEDGKREERGGTEEGVGMGKEEA